MVDSFILPVLRLTHLLASTRSSRRSTNGMNRLAAKELSPDNPIQPNVADNAFVQVIMMLRKTFIQDSVGELHPCHPIWQHSIFSDPAYLSFKSQVDIIA
ncbi:hypothetical protein [Absidia glauca]|uniref:Uncharacterized protein n=1 Tax=Absidia glauca TaxID=4829 RepID=A0A163LZ42_ABSGL|nr:hypothetical protein [Absidia glauca]